MSNLRGRGYFAEMTVMYHLIVSVGLLSNWKLVHTSAAYPQTESDQSSSLDFSRREGLFLNVESPSQCYGRVTQWNFCYQRSDSASDTHGVKFLVYRQNGTTSVYNRVPNSITILQGTFDSRTSCISLNLKENEQFDIQPNDLIAACMIDDGPIDPLLVTSSERDRALHMISISDDCEESDLRSIDVNAEFSVIRNYLLVETVISSTLEFRAGNIPSCSSPSTTPGIYVNKAFPANSDGYVTSWNYCYYTDSVSITSSYTAVFNVWRRNDQSDPPSLSIVDNSTTFIVLQPQYSIAKIFCKREKLEPESFFSVMEGDYVGVSLPTSNPIPLIGITSDHNISVNYDVSNMDMNTLLEITFSSQLQALHLYATIECTNCKMTQIPGTSDGVSQSSVSSTSEEAMVLVSETRDDVSQSSDFSTSNMVDWPVGKISIGVIASAVIIVIVAAVTVIVVLIVVTYLKKIKPMKRKITFSDSHTIPKSFEQQVIRMNGNVAYWTNEQTSSQSREQQEDNIPTSFNAAYRQYVNKEREISKEGDNNDLYEYI